MKETQPRLVHQRLWQAMQGVGQILAQYSGQEAMLHEILGLLENHLGFLRTTIMLLSSDGQELWVEAVRGAQVLDRVVPPKYVRGEGITGRVLQTGLPIVVPRVSQEPAFQDRIHRRRERMEEDCSFLCVPVQVRHEVVGTLSADLPCGKAEMLDTFREFLSTVAGLIASDVKSRREAQQQRHALEEENRRLRGELEGIHGPKSIIGNSRAMREVYLRISQVAPRDTTVMIRGESGTGKELVAAALHYGSPRAKAPFVRVNCAALSEALIESELFGHEKGAFTGALESRPGRLEQAEGGTLFLDEIGDFSPGIQVKLLRVLQERQYERVGSNDTRRADVRVLVATHRDLETDVDDGRFRQDLYYRINVFPIFLPPLRKRREDILLLADHFVEKYARQMNKPVRRISTSAIQMMMAYHWPGNVRELENCIEHAVLLTDQDVIQGSSLPPTLQLPPGELNGQAGTLRSHVEWLERDLVTEALKRHGGNVREAAGELGITERMTRYKIRKYAIDYRRLFDRRGDKPRSGGTGVV